MFAPKTARDLTLNWVNERREQHGLAALDKMPEGDCLGGSCPIYNALKDTGVRWVGRYGMATEDRVSYAGGDFDIKLPEFAVSFISWHEQNRYSLQTADAA